MTKIYFIFATAFALMFVNCYLLARIDKATRIIKRVTDDRGFTSVVFVQGKDTSAMDYLSKPEIDSLLTDKQ